MKSRFFILTILAMLTTEVIGQSVITFNSIDEIIRKSPVYIGKTEDEIANIFGEKPYSTQTEESGTFKILSYETDYKNIIFTNFVINVKSNKVIQMALIMDYSMANLIAYAIKDIYSYKQLERNKETLIFFNPDNGVMYEFNKFDKKTDSENNEVVYIVLYIRY